MHRQKLFYFRTIVPLSRRGSRLETWQEYAIPPLRTAVRLGTTDHFVHNALGSALVKQGQFAEAEAAFREEVRLKPELANGHFSLGIALVDQKKFADAD